MESASDIDLPSAGEAFPVLAPPVLAPPALAPQPGREAPPILHGALLESRQRWRDFTTLASDLAFETDAAGRLTFLSPARVLGRPSAALLGRPVAELLLNPEPNPFLPQSMAGLAQRHGAIRGGTRGGTSQVWLCQADGPPVCYSLALAPLVDAAGQNAGLRGTGRDVTAAVREAEQQASALRRAQSLETLVRRVRKQVLASRMLAATLESLPPALGCAGAAMLEVSAAGVPLAIHRHGDDPGPLLAAVRSLLNEDAPSYAEGPGGEMLALLPHPQRRVPLYAMLAWRAPGGRPFDADDRHLLASAADLLFVALGNQALQQELELRARTDPLTGLLNRRAFVEDLQRRLDRQDMGRDGGQDGQPKAVGAVLFVDLDNFKPLNDRMGHEAGDAALIAVGRLLRDIVRPTDLVARYGGDEFVVWLQEADAEAAAMRAGAMCRTAVVLLPGLVPGCTLPLTFSIGGAMRAVDGSDTPDSLLARADAAMYAAKRGGRNGWRLAPDPQHAAPPASPPPPPPPPPVAG
ncbi:MAG: hypothetical protein JWP04_1301 [Belnapia sp.]|nr:hypothetical protein [Belnapia sp.]